MLGGLSGPFKFIAISLITKIKVYFFDTSGKKEVPQIERPNQDLHIASRLITGIFRTLALTYELIKTRRNE